MARNYPYTYQRVVNKLPYYYEGTFEERHGREHDLSSDYNGDYWISAAEYIKDLEVRLEEFRNLVNMDGGEAIDKLIELSNRQAWEK